MKEKQELHCHECNKYVQFDLDMSIDGNHVLNCPNCGHEHCRVVRKGVITGDRWDSRNANTINVTYSTYSNISTWTSYNSTSVTGTSSVTYDIQAQYFIYNSWTNTGGAS